MTNDGIVDSGIVFNIQRFSVHDGPGIRTTVFLKGCPLHCPWCSNPESQSRTPELFLRDTKCIKCGKCQQTCPEHAITLTKSGSVIDRAKCSACLKCTVTCPSKALEPAGRCMTVAEIMDVILRDKGYYKRSNGGLTLSGGEPLAQSHFTGDIFKQAKAQSIHTALDTAGCADWGNFAQVLPYTDLILFDLKHVDFHKHQVATGVAFGPILSNLRKILAETKITVWIRIPLIPKFNASVDVVEQMGNVIRGLPRLPEKVSLLPFHKFAAGKYRALGKSYAYADMPLITEPEIELYKKTIKSTGLKVDIGA